MTRLPFNAGPVPVAAAFNADQRQARIDVLRWHKFPVLDKGYVALVDVMGSDHEIVEAARVSYGTGTKATSDDRGLIRYMLRHHHTSPFEMAEIKLLIQMPMDCHRQQIRLTTVAA